MNTIIYLLKGVFKIFLILIGLAMILGGGYCAAMGVSVMYPFGNGIDNSLFLMTGIAALVALVGWVFIKSALLILPLSSSSDKNNYRTQDKSPWED